MIYTYDLQRAKQRTMVLFDTCFEDEDEEKLTLMCNSHLDRRSSPIFNASKFLRELPTTKSPRSFSLSKKPLASQKENVQIKRESVSSNSHLPQYDEMVGLSLKLLNSCVTLQCNKI